MQTCSEFAHPSTLSLDPDSTGNLRLWSGMVTHISVDDLEAAGIVIKKRKSE